MRQKHPKHPANSGRPHPPVLFIFENIERVDLALIFFSSLLVPKPIFHGEQFVDRALPSDDLGILQQQRPKFLVFAHELLDVIL